ncbi:MAG: hypothetical protein ACOVRN_07690, partial [Flavobacterium sp.]
MKKKLEAELISIAHRILKLKNRAELEQLQQETLNLYQKLSVLKFVEDNFNDVKPTIGFASAEQKLEEIYSPVTEQEEAKTEESDKTIVPETIEENTIPETAEGSTVKEESSEENNSAASETVAKAVPEADEEPATKIEEVQEEPAESEPSQETSAETAEEDQETEEVQAAENEPANVTEETVIDEPVTESDETATAENEETPAENPLETEQQKEQEEQQKHQDQPEEHKKLAEQPVTHHRVEITAEVGLHEDLQEPITEVPELPETGQLPDDNAEDTENGTGEGIDIPTGEPAVSQEEA